MCVSKITTAVPLNWFCMYNSCFIGEKKKWWYIVFMMYATISMFNIAVKQMTMRKSKLLSVLQQT